jgi:hypothetical protein
MSQAGRVPAFWISRHPAKSAKVADAMHFLLLPFAEKNSRVAESK